VLIKKHDFKTRSRFWRLRFIRKTILSNHKKAIHKPVKPTNPNNLIKCKTKNSKTPKQTPQKQKTRGLPVHETMFTHIEKQ
jgi:hypothetical protein